MQHMNNKGPAANEEDDLHIDLQSIFLVCSETGFKLSAFQFNSCFHTVILSHTGRNRDNVTYRICRFFCFIQLKDTSEEMPFP